MKAIQLHEMPQLAAEALEIVQTQDPPAPGSLFSQKIRQMMHEAPSVAPQKHVSELLKEITEYALGQVATQHWMEACR